MQTLTKREWLFAAAVVALRLLFIVVHPLDSDEPQHLHVVWGWSHGLVPYRDFFDNHLPLLHLLFAPLMRVLPESSAIFLIMRLAIAPFALASGWLLFKLGEPIVGRERAMLAGAIFCVMPPWLPISVEFRNDTLWIFFWLATLVLITKQQPLAAGVMFGLCFLASAKAAPMLLAHAAALTAMRRLPPARTVMRVVIGAAIPVLLLMAFLYSRGAIDAMVYATKTFNASFPVPIERRVVRGIVFALVVPLLVLYGRRAQRAHLLLFALWYSFIVYAFWPIISPRDYLPLVPLAALVIASTSFAQRAPAWAMAAVIVCAIWYGRAWEPREVFREQFVDAVTDLTAPNEYVFDLKGDSIFRPRPHYLIYDKIGRTLTNNGTFADRGPEEIVAHRCMVAIGDSSFIPQRTRAFLNEHFVDTGTMRVGGAIARGTTFAIAVPETYSVIARDSARIVIDGTPYCGPRFLSAGTHTIAHPQNETAAIVWTRAVSGKVDSGVWSRIIGEPRRDGRVSSQIAERPSLPNPAVR